MEKKQSQVVSSKSRSGRKRKRPNPKAQVKEPVKTAIKKDDTGKGRKRIIVAAVILAAIMIVLLLALLKGSNNGGFKKVNLDMPEFEESDGYKYDGSEKASKGGINLAVIPDFTVTKENQSFVIPYPENEYDAEFYFVDKESGEERYRTKRIKPGTVVRIPAYSFCEDGEHTYRVEVGVFDGENYTEIPSAVALEMNITKK